MHGLPLHVVLVGEHVRIEWLALVLHVPHQRQAGKQL
jgi:hypothetical protein